MNANRPTPYNGRSQFNQSRKGDVYANQGDGNFTVHNTQVGRRGFAGKIVLGLLVLDVVWFIWGMTAYTGRPDDHGDNVRALGFFILFFLTCAFGGVWFRRRL